MVAVILIYLITNVSYFVLPHTLFLVFLISLLVVSSKIPRAFIWALLSMFLFCLNSNLLFWLISFFSRFFKENFVFYSGLSILIIAILFGLMADLLLKPCVQTKDIQSYKKITFLGFLILLLVFHIDHFAYNKILFIVILIGVVCNLTTLSPGKRIIPFVSVSKVMIISCIFGVIVITITATLWAANNDVKTIAWPLETGVWATTSEKYDTSDWTLKSSYSYSLLKELMQNKFQITDLKDLTQINPEKEDAVFLITPTNPFSEEEISALDSFVLNGGKIVFLVDHTDLYGHARVVNTFINKYGLNVNFDTIFMPDNPYQRNIINDMLFVAVRPMTGCSIELTSNAHIRSSFLGFVSEDPDYTKPNFFSEKTWTPDDRVGLFPFWTVKRIGKGSITICTDSTIFSNFAIFQPHVLTLLNGLFQGDYIYGVITDLFPYFMFIVLILILLIYISKLNLMIVYFLLFFSLFIPTKAYVLFNSNVETFYPKDQILYVEANKKVIYEPQLPTNTEWKMSVSNLLSNLPRFGLFPYYLNSIEKIFNLKPVDLLITKNPTPQVSNKIKNLVVNDSENKNFNNSTILLYANPNLSDYYLGSWWTSLEISPFRKIMFQDFVRWINENKDFTHYEYPPISIKPGPKPLQLTNEKGETRVLYYSEITSYCIDSLEYVYLGNKVWGLLLSDKDKSYILGGPSLNDTINNPFYSSNWYGILIEPPIFRTTP